MNKKKGYIVNSNNFRPPLNFSLREETKGTKPLSDPVTVGGALFNMLIHCCRRIIFVNTYIKVGVYLLLLLTSLLWEYAPFPRTYFSRSSNSINQYLVKFSWMWTLLLTVPFILLTSLIYCCGDVKVVKRHLARIGIATAVWYLFTTLFVYYENNSGHCSVKLYTSKKACLGAGKFWHSLDISGHAFILIYSALVMIEEARVIIGWESIDHMIRDEIYYRSVQKRNLSSRLKNLDDDKITFLNNVYTKFTPYIKGLFIGITILICVWDLMLLATALYFHKMVEKLIGGFLAIFVWYITYRYWYPNTRVLPYAPGLGHFSYQSKEKIETDTESALCQNNTNRRNINNFFSTNKTKIGNEIELDQSYIGRISKK